MDTKSLVQSFVIQVRMFESADSVEQIVTVEVYNEIISGRCHSYAIHGENLGHGGPGLIGLQVLRLARGEEVEGWFGSNGLVAGGGEVVGIEPGVFIGASAVEVGVVDPPPPAPPPHAGRGGAPAPRE